MKLRIEVIRPKGDAIDAKALAQAIETALDGAAEDVKVDFETTTRTWKRRPGFGIKRKDGERLVSTDNDVYLFLNDGTRVRYATMTANFSAKTRVRYIGSYVGRGGVAFISRKHPRPGIKARKFTEEIAKKWTRFLPRIIQRSIDATLR